MQSLGIAWGFFTKGWCYNLTKKKYLSDTPFSPRIDTKGGENMASPSATLQKHLKYYVEQLMNVDKIAFVPEEIPEKIQEIYQEGASKLQDIKMNHLERMRLSLENEKLTIENEALKNGSTEKLSQKLKRSVFALELIKVAIEKRDNARKQATVEVDRNLLQHGVITFAGGRRKSIKNPDAVHENARIIRFDKEGLRRLSYQNDRGQIISEFDTRVFLGLHRLWEKYGRKQSFKFTEFELLQLINVGTGGKDYEQLRESLKTLFATSVVMQTYYKKNQNTTVNTQWFHLIQSKGTTENFNKGRLYSVEHEIVFSNFLQESLEAGYVSYISLAMLEDLQTQIAQALYLTLSGEQPNEFGYYEFPLEQIANHIYLTDTPAKNKGAIERGCNELIQATVAEKFAIESNNKREKVLRIKPADWFKQLRMEQQTNIELP